MCANLGAHTPVPPRFCQCHQALTTILLILLSTRPIQVALQSKTGRVSCVCDWLRDATGLDFGDRSWICNAAPVMNQLIKLFRVHNMRARSVVAIELLHNIYLTEQNRTGCSSECTFLTRVLLKIIINAYNLFLYYMVSQKTVQNCSCQNFVKFPPILIIFGRKMAKRLKLCDVYSFPTSPNSRHHTTVLNADVPNCYTML